LYAFIGMLVGVFLQREFAVGLVVAGSEYQQ
jgi:hypothetical protein